MNWFLRVGSKEFEPATYCLRQILGKVPIFSYLFKRYYFEQITGLKQ